MAHVLVAGATGYLGRHLVAELKAQGHRVRALVRRPEQAASLEGADEIAVAQITQPESLRGAADGIELAFSTVGITRQRDGLSYEQVDYAGNLALLRECERAGAAHFAYVAVLHGPELRQVRLVDAKERFVDALRASRLSHSVIRPTGFFSDMRAFLDMARRGRVYLIGRGENRINPISGRDLARACVDAAVSRKAEVEVGGPESFSYREIAELAAACAGKPARISSIPVGLLRAAAAPLRLFSPTTHGPLEFMLAVLDRDMLAPAFGSDRLADFFRAADGGAAAIAPQPRA